MGREVSPRGVAPRLFYSASCFLSSSWLRGRDLNPRSPGYEPGEMPLLHPAVDIGFAIINQKKEFGKGYSSFSYYYAILLL